MNGTDPTPLDHDHAGDHSRAAGAPSSSVKHGIEDASPADEGVLRIATRGSALALAQSEWVAAALRAAWPGLTVELHTVVTEGDRRRDVALASLGGKGVFTGAVQRAVLDGRADCAVHSAKDLPAAQVPGLVLAAVPTREDPRDVLVAPRFAPAAATPATPEGAGDPGAAGDGVTGLDLLPLGARVGTGSPRRVALLGHLRPDLKALGLRGNVDTRVRKADGDDYDAVVLAAAGLNRVGLRDEITTPLDPDTFVPAPMQGCLAIEARADDTRVQGLLSAVSDRHARIALRGERAFLARLGGSCTLPAGALLTVRQSSIELRGFLAAEDGSGLVRDHLRGPADDPEALGQILADRLLAAAGPEVRALVEAGRK